MIEVLFVVLPSTLLLDIAGPALAPRERGYLGKGATGIGVRTIAEFLQKRARSGR